jgi:hypothetical protein
MFRHTQQEFSRRSFVLGVTALSVTGLSRSPLHAEGEMLMDGQPSGSDLNIIPRDTMLKFNSDGSPLPFAGNTVVCHLLDQSPIRDSVAGLADALRSSSFASKLAILPVGSHHVTILGGLNDRDRAQYGWPSDLPISAPIEECNRITLERFTRLRTHVELPIRFELDQQRTLTSPRPCGLQLSPITRREGLKVKKLRDHLADEVFHFRAANHDSFRFHISMAYQVRGIEPKEREEYQELISHHILRIAEAAPIIELAVPEFTTFNDMFRFEVRSLLRT